MEKANVMNAINLLLLGMVVVWFVLLKLLFNRLERNHAHKYESMGRPGVFLRNNIASGFATFRFLFLREHRKLDDRNLSLFADGMLAYFLVVIAIVLGLLVFFPWS